MIKMIKMDLYRFFCSASTWIILLADSLLAFFSAMLVATNKSIQSYPNAGELLVAQINGGMIMILCVIAVLVFVSTKYKNGFIKNIANQLPRREMLVFPEIIVIFVICALHFLIYTFCTITAGAAFFGNTFMDFSFFAIIKLLIVQFVLHCGYCCFVLLFYMLTGSTTFTVVVGLLIAFKSLNVLYVLIEKFTHFNISQYMLDANIFQLGMNSLKPIYARSTIVGITFLLVEIVLLCMVMRKKEIK